MRPDVADVAPYAAGKEVIFDEQMLVADRDGAFTPRCDPCLRVRARRSGAEDRQQHDRRREARPVGGQGATRAAFLLSIT